MIKDKKLGNKDFTGTYIPVDNSACERVRQALTQDSTEIREIVEGVVDDPVLILECLVKANQSLTSGKPPCLSVKSAIAELGADGVELVVQTAQDRSPLLKKEMTRVLGQQKSNAKLMAGLCGVISKHVARGLKEEAATAGALSFSGEFLACLLIPSEMLGILPSSQTRLNTLERLSSEIGFDTADVTLKYLKARGVPQELCASLNPTSASSPTGARSGNIATVRGICLAAAEVYDAWETASIGNLTTIESLPATSSLRRLQISDDTYAHIHSDILSYLESVDHEKSSANDGSNKTKSFSSPSLANLFVESEEDQLVEVDVETTVPVIVSSPQNKRLIESIEPPLLPDEVPSVDLDEAVKTIQDVLLTCRTSEELVETLLDAFLSEGPFLRTALLLISPEEKKAKTIAASGIFDSKIATLDVSDPLSPLLRSSIRVESFGSKGAACSPFGSKAFVLAPLYSTSPQPVFLYADCGDDVVLSMEARSLFRRVIEHVNEKLPEMPGNFPDAFSESGS